MSQHPGALPPDDMSRFTNVQPKTAERTPTQKLEEKDEQPTPFRTKKYKDCISRHITYLRNLRHEQVVWGLEMIAIGVFIILLFLNIMSNLVVMSNVEVVHHFSPTLPEHLQEAFRTYQQFPMEQTFVTHNPRWMNSTGLTLNHHWTPIQNKTWF